MIGRWVAPIHDRRAQRPLFAHYAVIRHSAEHGSALPSLRPRPVFRRMRPDLTHDDRAMWATPIPDRAMWATPTHDRAMGNADA